MTVPADLSDVESAMLRPLTDLEKTAVPKLLERAWAMLKRRVPTVEGRVTTGAVDPVLVAGVLGAAVGRVLKNPNGYRQVTHGVDDYNSGFTVDSLLSTGELLFTADELADLSPAPLRGAFTITPGWPS